MHHYTYLAINFFTIIICFIFSFDKRIQFHKQFAAVFLAIVVAAIPFITWDAIFTDMGVWWFHDDYTLGFRIAGMPFEEWLFFFCIPFSCLFTYFCLDKFFDLSWTNGFTTMIVFVTTIVCIVAALLYHDRWYTMVTATSTTVVILYLYFIAKVDWIGKASLVFLILMLGMFPVNGILTGTGLATPVVNYNPEEMLNIRLLTIPIEDFVYGYTQFILVIYLFKLFQKKFNYENQTNHHSNGSA